MGCEAISLCDVITHWCDCPLADFVRLEGIKIKKRGLDGIFSIITGRNWAQLRGAEGVEAFHTYNQVFGLEASK